MSTRSTPVQRAALLGILLLGFALRVWRLGAQGLWYDETVSVYLAGKSIPALVAHTAGDIHPPGYYLLLHGWMRLVGRSDFAAAFLSLLFGQLLIALAYRFGARLLGPMAGVLSALLVAFSPYNLWYSQEVRMYTLAAVIGMGALAGVVWLLSSQHGRRAWRGLLAYVVCGALGLWVLYYFAFLLAALNLLVGGWWLVAWRHKRAGWSWLGRWAAAQMAVLFLYAPWIPIAWRQAVDPPVPPWRGFTPLRTVLVEAWSALSLGQSVRAAAVWPALVLLLLVFLLGLFASVGGRRMPSVLGEATSRQVQWPMLLGGCVFIPVLLIYLASFITPLYHVRYVFTYSVPFYIVLGAGLAWLWRVSRPALWLCLAVQLAFSGASIYAYHTDPRYASDDHRAATAFLADRWRPGDAILVDAGYVYPALLAYWDADPIAWRGRLVSDGGASYKDAMGKGVVVLQAGTVDGGPSLGWGSSDSDFYSMSRAQTDAALSQLFSDFDRVWVYRCYDTVTDPDGVIRQWLEEHGTALEDQVFTGESQLRVQAFLTGRLSVVQGGATGRLADGSLELRAAAVAQASVAVGSALDVQLVWRVGEVPDDGRILFAGLFDEEGERWAQTDVRPLGSLYPLSAVRQSETVVTPLRIWVPPGTPPGSYSVLLGWYRFVEGWPIWIEWTSGHLLSLGDVQVMPPTDWEALARPPYAQSIGFEVGDGVRLLGINGEVLKAEPGMPLQIELVWQAVHDNPEPGPVVLQLVDEAGRIVAESASGLLGGRVPFTSLAAGQTVRERRSFTVPEGIPPGMYDLLVGRRRGDGTWLPIQPRWTGSRATVPLVTVWVPGEIKE